jgi:hypothetical protein
MGSVRAIVTTAILLAAAPVEAIAGQESSKPSFAPPKRSMMFAAIRLPSTNS